MTSLLRRTIALLLGGVLLPGTAATDTHKAHITAQPTVIFGLITDLHHTNREDSPMRIYSRALAKLGVFVQTMDKEGAAFIVELGDFIDGVAPGKDPVVNLTEAETLFTTFNGPAYHVLGNHEFDDIPRKTFFNTINNTRIPKGRTYYSWDEQGLHCIVLDADYTVQKPHRPFEMNSSEAPFYTWKDAFLPPEQLAWLQDDLRKSQLPTVLFTHQPLDRADHQDHNIKNASLVRTLLEEDGQVIAVFSGHDHQGGYTNIKGIHYIVLSGNVGVSDQRSWAATSTTRGYDTAADNQFALVTLYRTGRNTIQLVLTGYGRQPGYVLDCDLRP